MNVLKVALAAGLLAAGTVASAEEVEALMSSSSEVRRAPLVETPRLADDPKGFWSGWKGGVELGLNGSDGNTEVFNFRAGANAERKTDLMVTTASAAYQRAMENSEVTKNRFELNGRNDWIFEKGSPWRYFVTAKYEYDDFQAWLHRVTLGNGIGYAFIENDTTFLLGRAGLGISREFVGGDNKWVPEGILGADFSHKLTERQKITASVDYLPSLSEFPDDYRVIAKAAWEIMVDPEVKMSLKIGVEDRYDSTPGDKKRNDVDYFALLVWSF